MQTYRGLRVSFNGFAWIAEDGNADAEFSDGAWRQCGGIHISTVGSLTDLCRQVDEYFADQANLTWVFVDGGTWTAFSDCGTAVNPFLWRINVCEDGTFDVNGSDSELQPAFELGSHKVPAFHSLKDAKQFCEHAEIRCVIQMKLTMVDQRRQEVP